MVIQPSARPVEEIRAAVTSGAAGHRLAPHAR